MNDDSLERRGVDNTTKGKGDELVGKVQRAAGGLTDNKSLKAKGTMRKAKGNAKQGVGRAERRAHDALNHDDDTSRTSR